MNKNEFVKYIKQHVRDSALEETVRVVSKPPGRAPQKDIKELSEWYNALNRADRIKVDEISQRTLDLGIFGFLCALDGVRAIEDKKRGSLVLSYEFQNGRIILNDEEAEYLHDLYMTEVNS